MVYIFFKKRNIPKSPLTVILPSPVRDANGPSDKSISARKIFQKTRIACVQPNFHPARDILIICLVCIRLGHSSRPNIKDPRSGRCNNSSIDFPGRMSVYKYGTYNNNPLYMSARPRAQPSISSLHPTFHCSFFVFD